ncbi:hypothetical protein LMH87_012268 [Akanthomyces muscarius]|uniref:Uncharacterized protein n=1 Tax=Akanthomyces muscarius TaxID=2231603 RepID=A0A9W8UJA0_AKAMU|nr:hypothetical protein LMH87_012268 [Akanthomyces muscarius]KAJ4151578.1 hypothetical protein LMH87_012268 [Akanthomyces muscarius]
MRFFTSFLVAVSFFVGTLSAPVANDGSGFQDLLSTRNNVNEPLTAPGGNAQARHGAPVAESPHGGDKIGLAKRLHDIDFF